MIFKNDYEIFDNQSQWEFAVITSECRGWISEETIEKGKASFLEAKLFDEYKYELLEMERRLGWRWEKLRDRSGKTEQEAILIFYKGSSDKTVLTFEELARFNMTMGEFNLTSGTRQSLREMDKTELSELWRKMANTMDYLR